MRSPRFDGLLLCGVLTTLASGQWFSSTYPGTFVDLSPAGTNGTAITPLDDSTHQIVTTLGNGLFPPGFITIGNNGIVWSAAGEDAPYQNSDIPPTGVPDGMAESSNGIICAYWDDLLPDAAYPTQIYWQEAGGVLYIEWYRENHFGSSIFGEDITFEVQIFSSPAPGAPWIQIFYPDATFGGSMAANDNGASATVGWVKAANAIGRNAKWSFDTAGSVPNGLILSIFPPMLLNFSSPFGPSSIQVDMNSGPPLGTYFFCVTLNAGTYPNGWFFGITPTFQEVLSEVNGGFPFVGGLDASGHFTIGPISGAPSGLTVYAVALGFDTPALDYPSLYSTPKTYTVP
jgi:hypothetical protein